jgi:uncharacterized damage-inducible protein DinB
MEGIIKEILTNGLKADLSHVDPVEALSGLSHKEAAQELNPDHYSSWELLYHAVYWQERILDAIKGKPVNWDEAAESDWPSYEEQEKHSWDELVDKFENGIEEAERLIDSIDADAPLHRWRDMPAARAFMILELHNSYHIGQIVANRKMQGIWPPVPG